jgi:hypothetical protein
MAKRRLTAGPWTNELSPWPKTIAICAPSWRTRSIAKSSSRQAAETGGAEAGRLVAAITSGRAPSSRVAAALPSFG